MRINLTFIIALTVALISSNIASLSIGVSLAKEKYYEEGYQEGSVHTAELLNEISTLTKEQKQEIAVIWWTDTKDMLSARKAICGKPKSTQTKKD